MADSKSVTAVLRAQDSGFTNTFQKASSLLSKFSSGSKVLGSTSSGVTGSIKSMASAIGLYKAAAMTASAVTSQFTSAVSRYDTLNNFPKIMSNMNISAEQSQASISKLSEKLSGLPTTLDGAASGVQRFTSKNQDVARSTDMFLALNNAVIAGGQSADIQATAIEQISQAYSKGKPDMVEWKSLLSAMPAQAMQLGQAFGMTADDLGEALRKGDISMDQFMDKIMELNENGANGFQSFEEQARNAVGGVGTSVSLMKSAITRGVEDAIRQFDTFGQKLGGLSLGGIIQTFGKTLEKGMKAGTAAIVSFADTALPYVQSVWERLKELKDVVVSGVKPYIDILKEAFVSIGPPIVNAINAVISEFTRFGGAFIRSETSINGFRDVVTIVADKIVEFANKVAQNADKIVLFGTKALKAYGMLKVFQGVAGFAAPVLEMAGGFTEAGSKIISTASKINGQVVSRFVTPLLKTLKSGSDTAKIQMMVFGDSLNSAFSSFGNKVTMSPIVNAFASLKTAAADTFPVLASRITSAGASFSAFAYQVRHPIQSLAMLSAQAGGTGTAVNGLKVLVANGTAGILSALKTMAVGGISAIKGLGAAMLANPIGIALAVAVTAIVGFAAAWKSNFNNIQGFVKSALSGIGNSLKSMSGILSPVMPIIKNLGNAFKTLGTILAGGILLGLAGLVDGFRGIVTAGMTVIQTATAVGNAIKGLWAKIKGDDEGADKAFKAMNKNIEDIKSGFKDFADNSAVKSVVKSTDELGKSTEKAAVKAKALGQSTADGMSTASSAISDYGAKLDEVANKMSEAFGNPDTGQLEGYFQTTLELVNNLKEKQLTSIEDYNAKIEAAEGKSEDKKQKIYAEAAAQLANETKANNDSLLKVHDEYRKQLVENKTLEGQELTAEQRSALQEQTDVIREQLQTQNQEYIDAQMNRIANGQALTAEEHAQTVASLQTLGQLQSQTVGENNAQIQQLQQAHNAASSEAEKEAYAQQIADLQAKNAEIVALENEQGAQLLELLVSQYEGKATAMAQGLAQMTDLTSNQLAGIYQEYVANGASIDEQLALLAGVMQSRGVEAGNGLVEGLMSNDPTAWAGMEAQQIVDAINVLPPEMFGKGQEGKDQLVSGIQNGTTEMNAIGSELINSLNQGIDGSMGNVQGKGAEATSQAVSGAESGSSAMQGAGLVVGGAFTAGFDSKKGESTKSGKSNATAATDGAKSEQGGMKNAGVLIGGSFTAGVDSKRSSANSSGTGLANATKSGAGSVDFTSVGSNMAAGVASGITANTGAAVAAMQSLVAQVNAAAAAKAEIKSPSRLFKREIGFQLPAGVAVGIEDKTYLAVNAMENMIDAVSDAAGGSSVSQPELKVVHDVSTNISERFDQLLEKISNMQMIVDGGALVGAIGSEIDGFLGTVTGRTRRYK